MPRLAGGRVLLSGRPIFANRKFIYTLEWSFVDDVIYGLKQKRTNNEFNNMMRLVKLDPVTSEVTNVGGLSNVRQTRYEGH